MNAWSHRSLTALERSPFLADHSLVDMNGPGAWELVAQLRQLDADVTTLQAKLSILEAFPGAADNPDWIDLRGAAPANDRRKDGTGWAKFAAAPSRELDILKAALESERIARQAAEERAARAEARAAQFRQLGVGLNALRAELSTL